jgi:7,8-dihydropterin-6-yl-methyl-4-(beta-D-ribofuranosyl)aminobenzene 5'-phosphate synthase
MEDIKLSILCDNTAAMREGIRAEHGFSVLIEAGESTVLFDTGQSDVFWHNAEILGRDLMQVDTVILSHGHYDHTGGLQRLARAGKSFTVLGHQDVFSDRFKKLKDGSLKFIGCPFDQRYLKSRGLRFKGLGAHDEVVSGIFFVSEVPRQTDFEKGDPLLVKKDENGEIMPDPFLDDASLYIKTPDGLVVILGCSHRGMVNILNHILTLEGDVPILCVIGGTHLSRVDQVQTRETIEVLRSMRVGAIGVSHCTGLDAAEEMKHAFGKRFFRAMAGMEIEINGKGGITLQ